LTTEEMIAEKPQAQAEPAGDMRGGMGGNAGMGGMM
jgi:hypothetical protein